MAVFAQAMKANTLVKVRHQDMRPMVLSGIEVFSQKSWIRHLTTKQTVWTPGPLVKKEKHYTKAKKVQQEIYETIRDRTNKRKRMTVYGALTSKRLLSS